MRWRDPDAGKIVKAFFSRRKYDSAMNPVLHLGYIVGQLPLGQTEVTLLATDCNLVLFVVYGDESITYYLQRVVKGEVVETPLVAEYGDDGLKVDYTPGAWEHDLELAYAIVRDSIVPKIGAGI